MATETSSVSDTWGIARGQALAGVGAGVVGSALFGLFMQFVMPPPLLETVIPAMYGVAAPALAVGWALHLFHGAVLGLVYALVVELAGLHETATRTTGAVGLGIVYGLVTTAVLAVLVMPIWLGAVGFPNAPPFPNVAIPGTILSTAGHVVYAVPLALLYASLTD